MKKKNLILVSLREEKSKRLASVISNKTCRRILEYLENKKDAAEGEIAKDLNLPISTVHYNLSLLKESNLIKIRDFVWSDKGRKVNLYESVRKLIVFLPENEELKSELKGVLFVGLIGVVISGFIHVYTKSFDKVSSVAIAESALQKTMGAGVTAGVSEPNYALWFLFGVLFVLVFYLVYILIKSKTLK